MSGASPSRAWSGSRQTLTIRDDGPECHLAWCVGLTAEVDDPAADALLARLGGEGQTLLDERGRGAGAMSDEGLTTGWEADVPAEDSLLRAYVLATAERSEQLARAGDGRYEVTDTATFADAGSPVLFDNAVVFTRPLAADEARATIQEALAFFPTETPFVVFSAWPIPGGGDLGIALMGHPPFMFRPVGPPPAGHDAGLDIREVTDADGLITFFRTIVEAYPMPAGAGVLADPRGPRRRHPIVGGLRRGSTGRHGRGDRGPRPQRRRVDQRLRIRPGQGLRRRPHVGGHAGRRGAAGGPHRQRSRASPSTSGWAMSGSPA